MSVTPYNAITCVVAATVFFRLPRPNLVGSAVASLMLGVLWPLVLPVPVYFLAKKHILKREFATKRSVLDVELYGCMAVGLAGFVVYLWVTGNPVLAGF